MVPRNKVGAPDSRGDSDRLVGLGQLDRSDWSNGGGYLVPWYRGKGLGDVNGP
jgi:hypothetical protein